MEKRDTTGTGNATVGVVLAALMRSKRIVLLPFGEGGRYDLAFDDKGLLMRVQCKTGWVEDGCVLFNASSISRDGVRSHYRGSIDFFGVWCPQVDRVYLVPVGDVPATIPRLRMEPPRNKQVRGVRWAAQYEIAFIAQSG